MNYLTKNLFSILLFSFPIVVVAQDICEPVYTVPRLMLVNSVSASVTTDGPDMENTGQNATGQPRTIQMFAGQALQETEGIDDDGFYSSTDLYNVSWGILFILSQRARSADDVFFRWRL